MKISLTLISALFIFNLNAATLNCIQTGQETQGMTVKAKVSGEFSVLSKKEVNFKEITFEYSIDEGEDFSWSKGKEVIADLTNKLDYRPRKYVGHMKFEALVNGFNREEYPGFGALDLIIPSDKITTFSKESFTSFLILTAMDDHFGGTVSLNCSIK